MKIKFKWFFFASIGLGCFQLSALAMENDWNYTDNRAVRLSDGSTATISTGIVYHIKTKSDRYLEGNCNGSQLSDRNSDKASKDQKFSIEEEKTLPGFYRIKLAEPGGKYVEAYCGNSRRVGMRSFNSTFADQLWGFYTDSEGYTRIYNPRFLEIGCSEGDAFYGCGMRPYDSTPSDQQFSFNKEKDTPNPQPLGLSKNVKSSEGPILSLYTGTVYFIENKSGRCLEGNCNGSQLSDRKSDKNSKDQKFSIEEDRTFPGFYRIKLAEPEGKYLEAYCGNTKRVGMRSFNSRFADQLWGFCTDIKGYTRIYNPRFLEIGCSEGDAFYGCSMRPYDSTPSDQQFLFAPTNYKLKALIDDFKYEIDENLDSLKTTSVTSVVWEVKNESYENDKYDMSMTIHPKIHHSNQNENHWSFFESHERKFFNKLEFEVSAKYLGINNKVSNITEWTSKEQTLEEVIKHDVDITDASMTYKLTVPPRNKALFNLTWRNIDEDAPFIATVKVKAFSDCLREDGSIASMVRVDAPAVEGLLRHAGYTGEITKSIENLVFANIYGKLKLKGAIKGEVTANIFPL